MQLDKIQDRSQFEKRTLKNGITWYANSAIPVDFTSLYINLPVGHAHNTGDILPGTFHFLEHMCFESSRSYPDAMSFNRTAGLVGGGNNALTSTDRTQYELSAPNAKINNLIEGLFDQIFHPVFPEINIKRNQGVIANERQRRARYFPSRSEISQYENTQWKFDNPFPLQQIFGNDEDLEMMTPENLRQAQQYYFDPRIYVVVVGSANLSKLEGLLSNLEVHEHSLPMKMDPLRWQDKSYRVVEFNDASRFTLTLGGIIQSPPDPPTMRQLRFILNYLTNHIHGPLYHWLRVENSWAYNLSWDVWEDRYAADWALDIPLQNTEQVNIVRREWRERAYDSLSNKTQVFAEVERLLGSSVYWSTTANSILGSANGMLNIYGRIITDTQWREVIEGCRDTTNLQKLFEQYCNDDEVGEYCAAPKD